jgi:hypothetical protein
MTWLTEYKISLKNIDAEEPLDVYLYRPMAFVVVKTFYSLPLTPNQYSLMALISGIISSVYFSQGTQTGFLWGAFYFLLFAIFDCCDGMQARLKKNGTEFGRMIDGLVDYAVNALVYIGLAVGSSKAYQFSGFFQVWGLVILAGISKAIHSIVYDHYLTEFLAYAKGDGGFALREVKEIEKRLEASKKDGSSLLRTIGLRIYLAYSSAQAGKEEKVLRFDPLEYCRHNLKLLKMWSFVGPTAHITFLILAYLLEIPSILFIFAIVFGNIWLVLMLLFQFQVRVKLSHKSLV